MIEFLYIVQNPRGLVFGVLVASLLECRRWLLFGLFVFELCGCLW